MSGGDFCASLFNSDNLDCNANWFSAHRREVFGGVKIVQHFQIPHSNRRAPEDHFGCSINRALEELGASES